MLAAIYRSGGGSDALEITEVDTPDPGPGEVRVRVALSGVNPTDWKALSTAEPPEGGFAVPVQDGSGTIDAVGEGVPESRVGERVWLLMAARERRWGTAAQYSVVPADQAVPLAGEAPFELGASLGVPALTAWHCLLADGPLEDLTVLVSGGAGAVGHMAIQLARYVGARQVIATVSNAEKAALAREAGADETVNYRDPDAAEQIRSLAPNGIDRFVEVDLAANLALDLEVAARYGVITSYAATPESRAELPVRQLMAEDLLLRFMLLYTIRPAERQAAINGVSQALAAGALRTLPLHRFALSDAAAAFDAVQGGAVGKVIIEIP
jgi:NADPH:quinone reductase